MKKQFIAVLASILTVLFLVTGTTAQDVVAEMDRLYKEGEKAYYNANYSESIAKWQKGLELAKKSENKKYISEFIIGLGVIYVPLGLYDKALSYQEHALAIKREIRDRYGESAALSNISSIYMLFGQYEKALSYEEQALEIRKEIKDRKGEGISLLNMGNIYYFVGQYEKALSYFEQALAISREIRDRYWEGGILSNIGGVYLSIEQYEKALLYLEQSLAIRKEVGDRNGEARSLDNIGVVYKELGQDDKALSYYEQALVIYRKVRDRQGESGNLNNIGNVYYAIGQDEKALSYFQQALEITKEIKERKGEADVLINIGNIYYSLKEYDKMLKYYEQALVIHREIKDRRGEAADLLNIGLQNFLIEKQYNKAIQSLNKSAEICSDIGGALNNLWKAQRGLGEIKAKVERYDEAVKHYEHALDTIEIIRAGLSESETKTSFMQDKLHVYDEFTELLQILHQKDPSKGYDRKAFETFERKQGRIFLEEMGKSGARNYAGLPDDVRDKETELDNRLAKLQEMLVNERSKPSEKLNTERIRELEKDVEQIKKEQQSLQEEIKTKYPDYYALKYPKPVSLSELQNNVLKEGEIMLIYNVMEKTTCMWAVSRNHFSMHTLDISNEELTKNIEKYRNIILSRSAGALKGKVIYTDENYGKLPDFYAMLFPEPVRNLIKVSPPSNDSQIRIGAGCAHYSTVKHEQTEVKTLYIIPTGPLYLLPFETVNTGLTKENSRYLIEDNAVAYLSSASLLKILRDSQSRRREQAEYPLVAFANPVYAETETDNTTLRGIRTESYRAIVGGEFVPLPETEDEVKAIKDILKAPDNSNPLWLKESASRTNVIKLNQSEKLDDYRYIVFSCHGILPNEVNRINQPAMVLSHPDPQDKTEGFLTMADVFGIKLNAQLITLSACNTGRGKEIKGEGTMGLTRAFMYAGTPAVSVTLWSVESQSSKQLSVGLFENLKNGKKRADALREIKLRMIRGDEGEKWKHPFYWAPVVVFGDGQ